MNINLGGLKYQLYFLEFFFFCYKLSNYKPPKFLFRYLKLEELFMFVNALNDRRILFSFFFSFFFVKNYYIYTKRGEMGQQFFNNITWSPIMQWENFKTRTVAQLSYLPWAKKVVIPQLDRATDDFFTCDKNSTSGKKSKRLFLLLYFLYLN